MAIHFKTTPKKNTLTANTTVKHYAQAAINDEINLKTLLQQTAKASNMHMVDALRLYYNLEAIIQKELKAGKVVRLGDIGSFQIGISSNGFDTPQEVTAQKITKAKINYRPGAAFKEMLKNLIFRKVKY